MTQCKHMAVQLLGMFSLVLVLFAQYAKCTIDTLKNKSEVEIGLIRRMYFYIKSFPSAAFKLEGGSASITRISLPEEIRPTKYLYTTS